MDSRTWRDKVQLTKGTLSGKTVVITGGARGIGKALIRVFLELGASVVAVDINEATDEKDGTQNLYFNKSDISIEADVAALAEKVQDKFGAVDILINNAAISPVSFLAETGAELWDRVMAVNLRGAFLTCRAFLPGMLRRGRGVILNMVSAEAMPFMTAYIASKQGLAGLSQSLAAELGETGVRVVAFGPGIVDTPGLNAAMSQLLMLSGVDQKLMMEGALTAEQAAAAAACLAVQYADDYHGQVVDGYTILERSGLFPAAVRQQEEKESLGMAAGRDDEKINCMSQTLLLCKNFQQIIFDTGAEFNKLPVFVRPMAKNRFKAKSGQGLGEWEREISALIALIGQLQGGDRESFSPFLHCNSFLRARLERFIDYCRAVPIETSRFIKDPEVIQDITSTMEQREEQVRSLAAALEQLQVQLTAKSK